MGVVALISLVASACAAPRQGAEDIIEHRTQGTFVSLPNPLTPAPAGALIRSERLLGAPDGAEAFRVLYHSTDLNGADIGVSGTVVVPTGPAPSGGRTVVSWAIPRPTPNRSAAQP